jgi:hypothetical protein
MFSGRSCLLQRLFARLSRNEAFACPNFRTCSMLLQNNWDFSRKLILICAASGPLIGGLNIRKAHPRWIVDIVYPYTLLPYLEHSQIIVILASLKRFGIDDAKARTNDYDATMSGYRLSNVEPVHDQLTLDRAHGKLMQIDFIHIQRPEDEHLSLRCLSGDKKRCILAGYVELAYHKQLLTSILQVHCVGMLYMWQWSCFCCFSKTDPMFRGFCPDRAERSWKVRLPAQLCDHSRIYGPIDTPLSRYGISRFAAATNNHVFGRYCLAEFGAHQGRIGRALGNIGWY